MNWFVELPSGVQMQITALVVAGAAFAFAKLIVIAPWLSWLAQFRDPLAQAIAVALIEALQAALPSEYPDLSVLTVQLVLAILAALGVFRVLRLKGIRPFA